MDGDGPNMNVKYCAMTKAKERIFAIVVNMHALSSIIFACMPLNVLSSGVSEESTRRPFSQAFCGGVTKYSRVDGGHVCNASITCEP